MTQKNYEKYKKYYAFYMGAGTTPTDIVMYLATKTILLTDLEIRATFNGWGNNVTPELNLISFGLYRQKEGSGLETILMYKPSGVAQDTTPAFTGDSGDLWYMTGATVQENVGTNFQNVYLNATNKRINAICQEQWPMKLHQNDQLILHKNFILKTSSVHASAAVDKTNIISGIIGFNITVV